jgi:hypothetical protein
MVAAGPIRETIPDLPNWGGYSARTFEAVAAGRTRRRWW